MGRKPASLWLANFRCRFATKSGQLRVAVVGRSKPPMDRSSIDAPRPNLFGHFPDVRIPELEMPIHDPFEGGASFAELVDWRIQGCKSSLRQSSLSQESICWTHRKEVEGERNHRQSNPPPGYSQDGLFGSHSFTPARPSPLCPCRRWSRRRGVSRSRRRGSPGCRGCGRGSRGGR